MSWGPRSLTKHPTTETSRQGWVNRTRLDIDLSPLEVLRRFRGRDRLVALIGAWHHGEALIAFDPAQVLVGDPFEIDLDRSPAQVGPAGGFGGGWIGAWGHQLGSLIERLPPPPHRPIPQPDHRIAFYDHVVRRVDGQWWLESLRPDAGRDAAIEAALRDHDSPALPFEVGTFDMTPHPDAHRAAVARVIEHIEAGDLFQANLCTRLEASWSGDPLDAFCAGVDRLSPAYAAFVSSPDGALASFSPELFLRRTGDEVLTSPIKGTAPLESDPAVLVASAKDRAENIMIVDLMRNDLGKVCVPGSVRVPAIARAERHAVWHLVSDVVGHLDRDVSDAQLLRATFPPGSVTGAPKVRALQIIAELESTAREAYTGAIGHVSAAAGLELSVVIRTFEFSASADRVWLGVGGGVVADSTPDGELAECLVKARPLIEAIGGRLNLRVDVEPARSPMQERALPIPSSGVALGLYDTGLYDTVLVEDGVAVDVDAHLARLDASVRAVHGTTIRAGLDDAVLHRVSGLVGRHRLRIDALPVGADESTDGSTDVRVTLAVRPITGDVDSWTLRSCVVPGGLGQHKWSDRSVLAPVADPAVDQLLVDVDGSLLESGRASLFLVMDDGVHAPPTDGRILPGTARARIIEILRVAAIPVFQRRLSAGDLDRAHEVFVANALRGVVPVTAVDDRRWPAGRTTAWIRDELWRFWRDGPVAAGGERRESQAAAPRNPTRARVLFIDNYDSFVYNLVQHVAELGAGCEVVRNDAVTVDDLMAARDRSEFTHLVVSPGPGSPADAGISIDAIRRLGPVTPTLGVCLGHQAIGVAYGAAVVRAPEVVHGKPSLVHHDGAGVYAGLPSPAVFARYHSLVVDEATLPPDLVATAHTASGLLMGVRHRIHPVEGVQMHPESILTTVGSQMLHAFLAPRR